LKQILLPKNCVFHSHCSLCRASREEQRGTGSLPRGACTDNKAGPRVAHGTLLRFLVDRDTGQSGTGLSSGYSKGNLEASVQLLPPLDREHCLDRPFYRHGRPAQRARHPKWGGEGEEQGGRGPHGQSSPPTRGGVGGGGRRPRLLLDHHGTEHSCMSC
jgi:hypothetical protein